MLVAFVLLLVVFRSPLIAVTSILFNLVGVAASFGFATLVFQHGYGASLLGIEHQGFVDAWAPLFFFALLFGLSMDYQLFLLAAIKERRDATGDARLAVREGIARTGRPITNAALIMIVVFVAFGVTGPIPPDRARRHPRPRRPARRHRHPDDARPVAARDARRAGLVPARLARPPPPARHLLPLTETDLEGAPPCSSASTTSPASRCTAT